MRTKILVLGKTGMLGSMVFKYLKNHSGLLVEGATRRRFEVEKFIKTPGRYKFLHKYDYVINCIGVINRYCRDDNPPGVRNAILVNALFPHELANFCGNKTKIIHIATDCVFSGKRGYYNEDSLHDPSDVYGRTKSLGEVFSGNFLNIRCSAVGPEIRNHVSLLDWFLAQKDRVTIEGYINHRWNGVTTLQFAQLCEQIIQKHEFDNLVAVSHIFHFIPNESTTKYHLLNLFKEVYGKKITIKKVHAPLAKNMILATKYRLLNKLFGRASLREAIVKLHDYSNQENG